MSTQPSVTYGTEGEEIIRRIPRRCQNPIPDFSDEQSESVSLLQSQSSKGDHLSSFLPVIPISSPSHDRILLEDESEDSRTAFLTTEDLSLASDEESEFEDLVPAPWDREIGWINDTTAVPPQWIRDLPPDKFLVTVGGMSFLALVGGFLNAVSVLKIFPLGVTHLTGITTYIAIASVDPYQNQTSFPLAFLYFCIFSFLLGAFNAGLLLNEEERRQWGIRQGYVLLLEAVSLWLAYFLVHQGFNGTAALLISYSSGLQFDLIHLRTINITGIVTDVGSAIGYSFRGGWHSNRWKIGLWSSLFFSFSIGASLGALVMEYIDVEALLIPCACISLTSVSTFVFIWRKRYTSSFAVSSDDSPVPDAAIN